MEAVRRSARSNKGVPRLTHDQQYPAPEIKSKGGKGTCRGYNGSVRCKKGAVEGEITCALGSRNLAGLQIPISAFPIMPTDEERQEIHQHFDEANSEENRAQRVCFCCGRMKDNKDVVQRFASEYKNLHLLKVPTFFLSTLRRNHREEWDALFNYRSPIFNGHFIDPAGLTYHEEAGECMAYSCKHCVERLDAHRMPDVALANGTWTGPIPVQLSSLTVAEQLVIGLSRTTMKAMFYLKSPIPTDDQTTQQRASKGHWLSFPQHLGALMKAVTTLPHSPAHLASMIQVSLVGPPPYADNHIAKLFSVDPVKIRAAFEWLSTRNHLYNGIDWDYTTAALYVGEVPPGLSHIRMLDGEAEEAERAGYAPGPDFGREEEARGYASDEEEEDDGMEMSHSGVVDMNGIAAGEEERQAAALGNLLDRLGKDSAASGVPTDDEPALTPAANAPVVQSRSNTIDYIRDPNTISSVFPILYPYGIGGFCPDEKSRVEADGTTYAVKALSIRKHSALLLRRSGQHFATHPHFVFFAYDAITRQDVSLKSTIQMKRISGARTAALVNAVSRDLLQEMQATLDKGGKLEHNAAYQSLLSSMKFIQGQYMTVENQGRGSLHLHILIWLHGQPRAADLAAKLTDPAEGAFHDRLMKKMDCLVKQDVDGIWDEEENARLEAGGAGGARNPGSKEDRGRVDTTHVSIKARPETRGLTAAEWQEANERHRLLIAKHTQRHACNATCWKKGPTCRFGYPFDAVTDTFIETEHGRITLRRRDPSINGHNPDITTLFGGNSDIKLLFSGDSVLTRVHYMTKYMTKSLAVADRLVAIAYQQREMDRIYNNATGDTAIAEARRFIVSVANRLGAEMEVPAVSAAFFIIFNKDHYTPDVFAPLRLGMFDARVNSLEAAEKQTGPSEAEEFEMMAITEGEDGTLLEHNQADDYIYRHPNLHHLSLYQLTSTYRIQNMDLSKAEPREAGGRQVLSQYEFHPTHPRCAKQVIKMRSEAVVPRITGRSVAHFDSPNERVQEIYAKQILILFKPWTEVTDLRRPGQTWVEAFAQFSPAPEDARIIENLKLLHRMKEEVVAERALRIARGFVDVGGEGRGLHRAVPESFATSEGAREQMLQLMNAQSAPDQIADPSVAAALNILVKSGFLPPLETPTSTEDPLTNPTPFHTPAPISEGYPATGPWLDTDAERQKDWRREMKEQNARIRAKKQALSRELDAVAERSATGREGPSDGVPVGQSEDPGPNVRIHNAEQAYASGALHPVTFGAGAKLNKEQLIAFCVMAYAAIDRKRDNEAGGQGNAPTIAMITGPGGTGKTKILTTFTEWAAEMNITGYLRKAAPTATAAAGILGQTLHSLCTLSRGKQRHDDEGESDAIEQGVSVTPSAATIAEFRGAEMLAIDEISMVGHAMLTMVYNLMCSLFRKQSGLPFGGMNIIALGDWAQFSPVLDVALYLEPGMPRNAGPGHTPLDRFKPNLTDVIILHQAMRQIPGQKVFKGILRRLRKRKPTTDDVDVLKRHILPSGQDAPDISGPEWRDALVISRRHSNRRAICEHAARRHAREVNQPCYAYAAKYFDDNREGPTDRERSILERLAPGDHGGTDSIVYFTIGSPGVIGHNISTPQGITNGAYGKIVGVRFAPDDGDGDKDVKNGLHYLSQPPAIVFFQLTNPHPDLAQLKGLPRGTIALYPGQKFKVSIKVPGVKAKRTFQTCQLQFFAAYAVTDYKSQGQTAERLIIDFTSPPGTRSDPSSAYVQLSRGRSLENVAVLRDFDVGDLRGVNQERNRVMMAEMEKLGKMAKKTIMRIEARIQKDGKMEEYRRHLLDVAPVEEEGDADTDDDA